MTEPLVSVITPVYNSAQFLEACISSVLAQTYQNWEMLIADDNSTDTSVEIIQKYCEKDARIKIFRMQKNSGTAAARNLAIQHAKGKYITFLDADDCWKKQKLLVQVSFMEENNYSFTFSQYELIDADGKLLNKIIECPEKITYKQLLRSNTIGCLTAIYNAETLGKQFMPDIKKRQDYGLWLSLLRSGITGYGIQQSLAFYRQTPESLSANKLSVLKYNWQVLRRFEKLDVFSAAYYFSWFLIAKTKKYFS